MGKVIPFRKRTNWTKPDAYVSGSGKRRGRRGGGGKGPGSPKRGGSARLGRIAAYAFFALLVIGSIWWRSSGDTIFGPPEGETVMAQFDQCGTRGRGTHCTSDGDTVTIGYGADARRIRLTGFDAPEIEGACKMEIAKAHQAEDALRSWLNEGSFQWDGGAQPPRDKYGRELRYAWRTQADGTVDYLARHMIDAGLASGDGWGEQADWCG